MASGPQCVGCGILCDGEDLPGRRLDHDDHRLAALIVDRALSGVLHGAVQADRHRRGRRRLNLVKYGQIDVVLVDADDPPARLAVELVDHRFLHLGDQRRREVIIRRQQFSLRGDHHTGQAAQGRGDVVVVIGAQRDQVDRLAAAAGLLGQSLWVVDRLVEGMQHVDHRPGRADQEGAGLRCVQCVVVQVARRQHIAATDFVHRRPSRRVSPQRERLMLTEARMQVGAAPANLPMTFVTSHFQLPVICPVPVLGQMPGVAIADRTGVLGVLRSQNLGVEVAGLQAGPGRIESFARVAGVVAEIGSRRGVAGSQRGEEFLGRRRGALLLRRAARHRGRGDKYRYPDCGS